MAKSSVIKQAIEAPTDEIAKAIEDVAKAARTLKNTRLSDKALYLLLAYESGCSQAVCKQVLDAAAALDRKFVRR